MSDNESSHDGGSSSHDDQQEPSVDSETLRRQKHPENYNPKNKLKLGQFHRYAIEKPKKRATSNKKRIRDMERLLEKKGETMPAEVRQAKLQELKEMKRAEKGKKEAEKFESRYKKIRFFEKKKIIRKLEQLEKEPDRAKAEEERSKYKNYLTYVNLYPNN
jgi:predicted oxidoreductase (fatty acid repression mutant protein)